MMRWNLQRVLGMSVVLSMACLPVVTAADSDSLGVEDLVRLLQAGVGPKVIERQVDTTRSRFDLTVDDLVSLRKAGAGDDLLSFLQERSSVPSSSPPSGKEPDHATAAGIRVIHLQDPSGGEAIVLTNLKGDGPALRKGSRTFFRGLISRSDRTRPGRSDGVAVVEPGPQEETRQAETMVLPAAIEITIHRDESEEASEAEARLTDLEERLEDLESAETIPPVGSQGFPRHPINDHRDYPLVSYPYGIPLLAPFAFEPQEFRVIPTGTFLSFTGALAAGVDLFHAPGPCTPGQACSVSQRLLEQR
ncbi:MAG: hypothetical protein ACE5ID_09305 [Acidobacteriota bacterium]